MKAYIYFAVLAIIACSQIVMGDTLTLVGATTGNFAIGWFGEAWKNIGWCGDTLVHDPSPDTTYPAPDTIFDFFVSSPISDTVFISNRTDPYDSLFVSTTSIRTQTILRDSLNAPVVNIANNYKTIIDSNIIVPCSQYDFITDTGGFKDSTYYFSYYYKFRNYYAQLPFVFLGWQGEDSAYISPYKTLLITYKGLLPTHQIKLSFFYGAWGANKDSMANALNHGDGVGTLAASPDEWKSVVIQIPDSVQLPHIAGITLAIENVPNGGGGQTSDVGNLKVYQISLIAPDSTAVKYKNSRHAIRQDRFHFTPKSAGKIMVSVYSLNGVLLGTKALSVDPSKSYSVRLLAQVQGSMAHGQMRIVKIQGAGVDIREKIW
jgi:hypothetical protein